ncbi:MAG: hypothetical protein K0Q48_1127 [Bacillota bacterium]|nr:hypothetical protein [Bacillota bacterium]
MNDERDNNNCNLEEIKAMRHKRWEESAGGRRFCMIYPKEAFYDYERRILSERACTYVLPMSFIEEEDGLRAYYGCAGCLPLKDAVAAQRIDGNGQRRPDYMVSNSVGILMEALENLKKMENHLLFPDSISISMNEVYINTGNGKVLLAYIPEKGGHPDHTFQKRITKLAEEMKTLYEGSDAGHFLARFIQFVDDNNPGLDGMINMLGMLRRETSYIYWAAENFRSNLSENSNEPGSYCSRGEVEHNKDRDAAKRIKPNDIPKSRVPVKLILVQMGFVLIMGSAVLWGKFDGIQLAGWIIIAAAIDLWAVKKWEHIFFSEKASDRGKPLLFRG